MSTGSIRKVAPIALAIVLCTAAASAQEEPSPADMSAARGLGQEGVKLADAGNCQEAVDKLQRAEKIFHAPTTLARLGECQVQLGKLVEGTENLNRVSRETLAPTAPQAFKDAQERARKILADTKPKIAKLKIAVAAPSDAQLTVKVDGENVPAANLNTNRPTDPGEHTVEVTAPGYKTATAKVRLTEGGVDSVALTLEVDPSWVKPAVGLAPAPGPGPAPLPPPSETPASSSRVPAYVAFGVGGAGLAVGAVFGLLALGKKGDLDDSCKDKVCPSNAQQDTIDSGKTLGTVSTIGFAVGIVGAGVGMVLLLTSRSPSTATATTLHNPLRVRVGGARVEPLVGAGQLGVLGAF